MTRRTPLYEQHLKLSARMVNFQGWLLPLQYQSILGEVAHCRRSAGLFDTSHMGQLLLGGNGSADDLSFLLSHDARSLPVGRCRYGLLLDEKAGIVDDTILMRFSEDEFLLVVNAGPTDTDVQWIRAHLRGRTSLKNQSASFAKLDLQGPESFRVLAPLVDANLSELGYFSVTRTRCLGQDCILSRTGYTGELGYEIFAPHHQILPIWQGLLAEPKVKPAGLGARDLLRLEMCYPLFGQDISSQYNPLEADLARFVHDDHEFIGSSRLKELIAQHPTRKLVAFTANSRRRANPGQEIWLNDKKVGIITSGAFSPTLDTSIGLGYMQVPEACTATGLIVRTSRADLPISVCAKPFYKQGTAREKLTPMENQ